MRQLYFPLQYKLSPGLTKAWTWTAERANRYLSFKADPEHFHQHWLTYNFRPLEGIGNEVDGRKVCKSTKHRDGWHFRRARSNLWTWQRWAFRVPKGPGLPAPHSSLTLVPGQCWLVSVFTSQSCEKMIPHACAWVHAHVLGQWGVAQEILPIPKLRPYFLSNVIFWNINKKSGNKPYIDSTKDDRESN